MQHLAYLQKKGVKFDRRVEHGMTHSLYIHDPNGYGVEFVYDLPKEVWKDDIEGALNYVKTLPTEGAEALEDRTTPALIGLEAADVPVSATGGDDFRGDIAVSLLKVG